MFFKSYKLCICSTHLLPVFFKLSVNLFEANAKQTQNNRFGEYYVGHEQTILRDVVQIAASS
jgi:hypothetical protein